jgi:hypothetical protein
MSPRASGDYAGTVRKGASSTHEGHREPPPAGSPGDKLKEEKPSPVPEPLIEDGLAGNESSDEGPVEIGSKNANPPPKFEPDPRPAGPASSPAEISTGKPEAASAYASNSDVAQGDCDSSMPNKVIKDIKVLIAQVESLQKQLEMQQARHDQDFLQILSANQRILERLESGTPVMKRETATLIVYNRTDEDRQLLVNGVLHLIRANESIRIIVHEGATVTQIPGHSRRTWNITGPNYQETIEIIRREEDTAKTRILVHEVPIVPVPQVAPFPDLPSGLFAY